MSANQQSAEMAPAFGQNSGGYDADRDDNDNHHPRRSQSAEIPNGSDEASPAKEMFEQRSAPKGEWESSPNTPALEKRNNDAGSARSSGVVSAPRN